MIVCYKQCYPSPQRWIRTLFKSRFFVLLISVLCIGVMLAPDADAQTKKRSSAKKRATAVSTATGTKDARYAALIMNPVTGEVYHEQNADAARYPASLTKMMTLYLLFEALERKEIRLSSDMRISELAARQPQTNLSLDAGDTIDVETAIKSLVVRSANDVSVVVAEELGGSVDNFARLMTNKARALGMNSTTFKNPNGLPNPGQKTTARDMAKLGIALKRDFPKYYDYFSTRQFSHNGVTYYTHNRVMLRYAGADGIKTGYIGASGFNLVTSVTRGGRPLVGVVMGGGSGAWRDNRMIQLLDQSYAIVASRGAAPGKVAPANLPRGVRGGNRQGVSAPVAETMPAMDASAIPEAAEPEDGGIVDNSVPAAESPYDRAAVRQETASSPFAVAGMHEQQPVVVTPQTPAPTATVTILPSGSHVIRVEPTPAPAAPVVMPERVANPTPQGSYGWGIQVGAFSSQVLADQAVQLAQQTASRQLIGAKPSVVAPGGSAGAVYRARLENLSQIQAKNACEVLIAAHSPCFTYKAAK